MARLGTLVALGAVVFAGAAQAGAQTAAGVAQSAEPFRLRFDAPPECPSSDVLAEQMLARSRLLRLAAPSELARVFEVSIVKEDRLYRGAVRARDAAGAQLSVSLTGSCAEVVSTLSLIAAMTVDPDAEQSLPAPFTLPENPYWRALARVQQESRVETILRENPYREVAASEQRIRPGTQPRALTEPPDPMLRANPYR